MLLRVSENVFHQSWVDHVVVNIQYVWVAAYLISISNNIYYYGNNTIDVVMINNFCPIPLEARGDMQTDDDDARRVEDYRNRNTSVVDNDKENKAQEKEEDKEKDDNKE